MTELTSLMSFHFLEDMRMQDAFKRIIGGIHHLQTRVSPLEPSTRSLAVEVRSLVSAAKLKDTQIKAYEIVSLYQIYYIDPAITTAHSNSKLTS